LFVKKMEAMSREGYEKRRLDRLLRESSKDARKSSRTKKEERIFKNWEKNKCISPCGEAHGGSEKERVDRKGDVCPAVDATRRKNGGGGHTSRKTDGKKHLLEVQPHFLYLPPEMAARSEGGAVLEERQGIRSRSKGSSGWDEEGS